MAISYSTLFARLGRLICYMNSYLTLQGTTLLGSDSGADDILDEYEARRDLVVGLESDYLGFASTASGWITRLKSYADATLSDLQSSLNAPNNSVTTILPLLVADMVTNSQTVNASTIGSPSISAGGSNIGNGQLIVSKKDVNGVDDQRIIAETVKVVCTNDQYGGGGSSGGEAFSVTGLPNYGSDDYHTRGNGDGPNITVGDSSANLLRNGNFDSFGTANTPDNWDIDNGVVGPNIAQEIVAANAHRGSSALKLLGDGSTTTVKLHQDITVRANTIYAVGVWLRKNGTVSTGSTLQVSVKGSGFSTVSLFNASPSTLTTSYVFYSAFVPIGVSFPSDLNVEIAWTSANSAGATAVVLVDDLVIQPTTAYGHTLYALFAGATDFVAGDLFTVTTSNDYGGVIQTAMGRWYDTMLPSDAVGGETIADSVAT